MNFGIYDSAREFKRARESNVAFNLRRQYRRIRAEARVIDPNAGFRLSNKAVAEGSAMLAIRKADQARREEEKRVAAINKRDRMMAQREAGTTRLPSRSR